MSTAERARWLLARPARWSGVGPAEVTLEGCSARVEQLVVDMRADGLFPDRWDEQDVLFAFLGALAEARLRVRRSYCQEVARTAGEETASVHSARGHRARLPDGRTVRTRA